MSNAEIEYKALAKILEAKVTSEINKVFDKLAEQITKELLSSDYSGSVRGAWGRVEHSVLDKIATRYVAEKYAEIADAMDTGRIAKMAELRAVGKLHE